MTEPRITGGTTGRQQLALAPPPCGTCQHEPICALKVALKRATTAEVTAAPLPDGLTVTLEAKVDCRFYKRLKGASTWSPERRAKMSAAITASNRRRAEAAEGKAS